MFTSYNVHMGELHLEDLYNSFFTVKNYVI